MVNLKIVDILGLEKILRLLIHGFVYLEERQIYYLTNFYNYSDVEKEKSNDCYVKMLTFLHVFYFVKLMFLFIYQYCPNSSK
jgi:hypothetical protein